jgi:hypothetical protein
MLSAPSRRVMYVGQKFLHRLMELLNVEGLDEVVGCP